MSGGLEVQPHRDGFAVFDGDKVVSKKRLTMLAARADKVTIERDRKAAGGPRKRPCLVCSKSFRSEGKHNRLCGNCRHINLGEEWV